MLKILYDPYMVEEIVFHRLEEVEGTNISGADLYEQYHDLSNQIYELDDEDERAERFVELNKKFFNNLGFSGAVRNVVEEFPELHEKIGEIHIRKPTTLADAGSNLVDERKKTIIRLFSEQFMDIARLKKFIRHELMHVVDILDERFGYKDGRFATLPTEEAILRERYRLFWDISIESRLERRGKETLRSKNELFREFENFYTKFPPEKRNAVFEGLWKEEDLAHDKIIELAKDTSALLAAYCGTIQEGEDAKKKILMSGGPCPLCKFPTVKWVDTSSLNEKIVQLIKADFSDWQVDDGICDRCSECYTVSAGLWFEQKETSVS